MDVHAVSIHLLVQNMYMFILLYYSVQVNVILQRGSVCEIQGDPVILADDFIALTDIFHNGITRFCSELAIYTWPGSLIILLIINIKLITCIQNWKFLL